MFNFSIQNYGIVVQSDIFRLYRTIGCPHGCGDGFRGSLGEHLRTQGKICLGRLQSLHPDEFKEFIMERLVKEPMQDIVDFMHAMTGFCTDPNANPVSPQGSHYTYYIAFM